MTVESIGWALIHSLWEGGVVAAALGAALVVARRARAAVRHALALVGLALLAVAPVGTVIVASRATVSAGLESTGTARYTASPSSPGAAAAVRTTMAGAAAEMPTAGGSTAVMSTTAPPARTSSRVMLPLNLPRAWHDASRRLRASVDAMLPWLVAAWAAGLLLLSVRLAGGVARARALARRATRPVDAPVRDAATRLAARLGVRAAVGVLESGDARAPMVVGFVRPVILLPATALTGLTPAQLEMLLAHELAHVRRHDVLVNLAQAVVETMLFFHPAVWWVSGRIREERENCCDDVALSACGGDAVVYSTVLLSLEESRGVGAALAAAANEGALLRRIARLVGRAPAHLDLGPRWLAGVITIVVALLGATEAVGVTPRPGTLRPSDVVGAREAQPPRKKERVATQADSARWRPAAVLRPAAGAALASRWRAAEEEALARGLPAYWVGWVVPGTGDARAWVYMDRVTPARAGEDTFTGRMYSDRGGDSTMHFDGVPLAPLLGEHQEIATTIFLRYDVSGGERRVTNVHVARYGFPMHFQRLPLLWLGAAGDPESVALLRRLVVAERGDETRSDLVVAVGMHLGSSVAEEALTAWMEDRSQRVELRRDATRWLGRQRDRRAFLALTRAARGSDERGVRVEAVEAMEDIPFDDVADTLITYVRALPDPAQRNEAIEALGHRTERRVVVFLQRLVDDGADRAIAKRAIESLGDMPEGRGADAVVDVARHHADPGLRRVAAEAVAHLEPTRRALDVLRDVAWTDSDPSVRVEAIEGIGDVHDARSVALLAEIAERHSDVRAQVEATEALAGTAAPDAAIEVLGRLARSHPRAAVQRKAAEALGDFDDARAVELLVALAESHADASVQVEAAEALGSVHPHEPAIAALKRLARTHPNAAVRQRALESLADYAAEGKR